ncbi:MAG: zinc-dependent alcohol dehydrogenase [Alphaproteobacteria bacterium]
MTDDHSVLETTLESQAFWVLAPGRGKIRGVPPALPGPGEVGVRALVSGISRGTESLVFSGHVPVSQYEAMRCPFQEGEFPGPVKYGYASVGVVSQLGRDVAPAWQGARVFCLYPHQSDYVVPVDRVVRVPGAVPDERAALAANMETALNGLWDGAPRLGDRICVVGGGVVGLLVAALAAQIPGTSVLLVDIDASRAAVAARLGLGFALPEDALREYGGGGADLVFHTSGNPAGLTTALGVAGFEAVVVEMSWYGDRMVPAPLGEAFHDKRLRLQSSQVGHVAPARRARHSRTARLEMALRLLADDRYDALITGSCPLAALPDVMAGLAGQVGQAGGGAGGQALDPAGALCHIVRYR